MDAAEVALSSIVLFIMADSGCVLSHSTRAAAVASIPTFPHQIASSPERWTSR